MAALSLSNWAQATAISVVTRDRKPKGTLSICSDETYCNEVNNYNTDVSLIQATENLSLR
jgi:hypothetical protein